MKLKVTNDMSLEAVLELSATYPDNAELQLECAFYCDGNDYVDYQNAITLRLPDQKLQIANNNLGRLEVLKDGLAYFPNFCPYHLFKARTLFDFGNHGEASMCACGNCWRQHQTRIFSITKENWVIMLTSQRKKTKSPPIKGELLHF